MIVPSSAPTSLSSSVLNPTTVLLTWSPPLTADQNGLITAYTVVITNSDNSEQDVYVTNNTTLIVASLNPYTTYQYTVAANTTVGSGPYSVQLAFQTVEDSESCNVMQIMISVTLIVDSLMQFPLLHHKMYPWKLPPPPPSLSVGYPLLKMVRMASSGHTQY